MFQNCEFNFTFFLESLEQFFIEKINTHFEDKKEKYLELTAILMEYLDKNGGQVLGKNDLFSAFRSYGYKLSDYKNFIKDMEQFKNEFYELAR